MNSEEKTERELFEKSLKVKISRKEAKKIPSNLPIIKRCHSFWHRECENRDIECHRCSCFY